MIYFNETQRFRQWWIWLFLILLPCIFIWGIIQQEFFGIPFGTKPAPSSFLALMGLIPLLILVMFYSLNLKTIIDDSGISFKMFPFHFKFRHLNWNEIAEAYAREYRPLREYGGWGIKYRGKSGKAYNISGNKGLQLVLKNGKKILLGSSKYAELLSLQNEINKKLADGKKG